MTKTEVQGYTTRVTQANPSELVVIIYDIMENDIMDAKNAFYKNDMETYTNEIKHAQKFLHELMGTLDFKYSVSRELMQLYIFINKMFIEAVIKRELTYLEDASTILGTLKVGFNELAKGDTTEPVMKNTQQVFVGLTYGKGSLNETSVDPQIEARGFRV